MLHHDQTVIAHFNAQTDENSWQNILILSQYLNNKEIYLIYTIESMGQFGWVYPQTVNFHLSFYSKGVHIVNLF